MDRRALRSRHDTKVAAEREPGRSWVPDDGRTDLVDGLSMEVDVEAFDLLFGGHAQADQGIDDL